MLREELPLGLYYEELHELIDSEEFRKQRGVRRVAGQLYDDDGVLFQQLDNTYSTSGALKHSRIEHADGTVTEIDR